MTTRNEAAERLRASVEQRIARLNPGQMTVERTRGTKKWAEIHLRAVLAEADEALAAERALERAATLERIRTAMHKRFANPLTLRDMDRILDEEAAR